MAVSGWKKLIISLVEGQDLGLQTLGKQTQEPVFPVPAGQSAVRGIPRGQPPHRDWRSRGRGRPRVKSLRPQIPGGAGQAAALPRGLVAPLTPAA